MNKKHQGSCLCNNVRYEIEGGFESFFLCHCKYCQKDTGSAHASNLISSSAKLNWISGTESIKHFMLPSTRHARNFCKECGSPVPSLHMDGKMLLVPAGSLDTKVDIAPTAHIFFASRAPWEDELDQARSFDKFL